MQGILRLLQIQKAFDKSKWAWQDGVAANTRFAENGVVMTANRTAVSLLLPDGLGRKTNGLLV